MVFLNSTSSFPQHLRFLKVSFGCRTCKANDGGRTVRKIHAYAQLESSIPMVSDAGDKQTEHHYTVLPSTPDPAHLPPSLDMEVQRLLFCVLLLGCPGRPAVNRPSPGTGFQGSLLCALLLLLSGST
ncbi:hypothetical protein TREES_T100018483 [Tupaia chinensis]|uniref:Uncharacterized protein n=1 Tax=Tupaia chinensis TaxID=246437 RepID=L9L2Q8_TUPCH|nr:hypothetical protein TREES_T100018483 [Tupaia chinensis]